jgi:hypothetical protein
MGAMNEREEEEFVLAFGTRRHRKSIKEPETRVSKRRSRVSTRRRRHR